MKEANTKIINLVKGVFISIISTVILLIIFAAILTYTDVQETTINPVIMIITAVSVLIGSSIGNIKLKNNGILNGAIIGGVYMMVLYIISSILNWNFSLNLESIIFVLIGVIFGIIGGIIGVNKK